MSAIAALPVTAETNALDIAPQTREQSRLLAHNELKRFVDLIELLDAEDWSSPTACTLWTVRDIVGHQGSHVQLGRGFLGWLAQSFSPATTRNLLRGLNPLDALNKGQVEMRRAWPLDKVIAEVRDGTPKSIEARQSAWWLGRQVRFPFPPFGLISLGFLFDVILPRDMWMHRHDIAAATGKPFVQTADHDGVIVEKTVLDAARFAAPKLPGIEVRLTLRGVSGGTWRFGSGTPVSIAMDAVDFMRRSSERLSVEDTLKVTESDAAPETTRRILAALLAPY